jgi:hypothetical protein
MRLFASTQSCRKTCCSVTFGPLVPAWATTIHKLQSMEAGFDETDQFQRLIIDPGDIKTKQQQPRILYVATSHANTIGDMTIDTPHPQLVLFIGLEQALAKTGY